MSILARLLGGRPMRLVGPAFLDRVSGCMVNYYEDRFGRAWLAESRWSLFRVTPRHPYAIWRRL